MSSSKEPKTKITVRVFEADWDYLDGQNKNEIMRQLLRVFVRNSRKAENAALKEFDAGQPQ